MNSLLSTSQRMDMGLAAGEVHIWSASLDQPTSEYHQLLSVDERARAERFYFEEDSRGFILRRGMLRTLIGYYLDIEPERVQFQYGTNEKPGIPDTLNSRNLHFSLSHSNGLALYAFSHDHEIGVDIEYIRDISKMEQIAERFFSLSENTVFQALPESMKREAFFNCWTRKEAFIKAIGQGLSYPLDKFDVSLVPDEPARLLSIGDDSIDESQWFICDLNINTGYKAALAKENKCCSIIYCQW